MFDFLRHASTPPRDLLGIIRYVRARWRARLAVKGAVRACVVNVVVFFALAYLMEWSRFTPASILFARLVLAASIVGSIYFFLLKPLRRRVTDDQVALYLEEKEPSLQTMLISAVESSREGRHWESSALVEKLVSQAIEKCCEADAPRRAEHGPLRVNGAVFAGVVSAAILAVLLGPAFFRHALSAVLIVSRSVEAAAPYKISVTPGNISVPKGADQAITARLLGFNAQEAALMVKRPAASTYEKLPLVRNDKGDFEGILFGIKGTTEYFVEAEGVGSTHFTLKVVDVPYVDKLGLEYTFPAYTGLEPEKIEDGGDIAVLRGTDVKVIITPTMKTKGGRIALDKQTVPLTVEADGTLTASFKADKDGTYHVELDAPNGERVAASPQYTIDVLTDRQPTVTFARPGRDTSASAIEEVYVEAAADDDYGVKNLELVYSVNGGPEKSVPLYNGSKRLPSVSAGHTFYLEELGVKSGDSVSYYARATDNDSVDGGQKASSDLYFVRVRPFDQRFRQAQSQGGGGGGGGGGAQNQVDALSEQQRQIISATFNVQRDKRTVSADKFRQNSTVVGLSQQKLREQVEGLLTRMNSEFIQQDPKFKQIADLLPQAVTAMKEAEGKLSSTAPDAALGPENKALTLLQKAEEEYETQVSVQQGGGGGGGGQSSQQRELADIFEQELDKMASRYETADRAMQANGDRQVDELLEKLKELARRQEQEAERERRLQQGSASATPSGSAQQRALADQAEEAARRLERLAREENRPELLDSARQMREAADAMRRAAAGGNASSASQAQQALDRLKETQRKLERSLSDRANRDIRDAQQRAEELAREQQEISNGVNGLAANGQQRREQAQRINEKKDDLEGKLGQLESDLDAAARDAAQQEKQASRKLSEAAGAIRDNRLRDKIRYSEALVNRGYGQETLRATENDIAGGIDQLKKRLDEAASALGQGQQQNAGSKAEQALDRTQRLARGLESLQERTRERAQQNARNQQGRDQQGRDQQGQQQGQRGQQAGNQQGQDGQQGQQGQGQQGQGQQGQNGQQGQGQQGGQQAGGQQGGGQQGGQQAGGANGGFGNQYGGYNYGGGYGYGNLPWNGSYYNGTDFGRLSDEDIRQLRAEARQWANEAQDLRGTLRGYNIDPKELEQILAALRRLEDERVYKDAKELQSLQTFATEGLKRIEFGLRRQVESGDEAVVLAGSDEVPDQFKKMVAEYYRSLGKTPR
ncbi:MAG TPA: DUF4175 family protein [Vicinamibacterales bacterium]|jgi:hypothetical protein